MRARSLTQKNSRTWITVGIVLLVIAVGIGLLFKKHPSKLFDRLPVKNKDIVFFGDSHFELFEAAEMLNDRRIKMRGFSGRTSSELLTHVDEIVKGTPRLVFLIAGANDAFRGRGVDAYLNDMQQLIGRIKVQSTELIPVSIPPATDPQLQARITEFNNALELLCEERQLSFVDLDPVLMKNGTLDPALTFDEIHLNEDGYARIVPLLKPHIRAAAPAQ
ncbi:MAG: GDSL-type esterase/lipase family protein [Bacteroidota bacterium]|nr:GDSL-type esterase/lipase family protein [Bacteroidota bacterium]